MDFLRWFLSVGWGTILTNISMKSFYHYAQNARENRFQVYDDGYWTLNPFRSSETEIIDLSVIKDIPFGLFLAEVDPSCAIEQAEITRQEMGDAIEFYK